MKVLFIGGTGYISTACTELAVARGFDVTLLNRSTRPPIAGAKSITADIFDAAATSRALAGRPGTPSSTSSHSRPLDIEGRLALFRGKAGQFVFISSASAYQKPLTTT
jgi:nucleoside-diphosphate-sugar epimerase